MPRKAALAALLLVLSCAGTREEQEIENYLQSTAAYYTQKGAEALEAGRLAEAINYFRRAAETLPNSPVAADNLGVAYYRSGKADSAIAAFQTAVRLQPSYVKAYIDLGYALTETKDFESARLAAMEALQREPENAAAVMLLAYTAQMQNRLEEAIRHYNQAARLSLRDPSVHLALAEVHQKRGDLDAALFALEKATEISPDDPMIYFHIGNIHAQRCRLDEAEASYLRALQINPRMMGALNNSGLIRMEKGDYQTAKENFQTALAADSLSLPALFNLSVLLSRIGNWEEALLLIDRALILDSTVSVFHLHKGNLLMELGRGEEAKREFGLAALLEPTNAMVYNNLGNILAENDPARAKQAYEKALNLYDAYQESRYTNEGPSMQGGFGDLLGGCCDIERRAAEYAMLHANLGRAKLTMGDLDQAQKHLEKAVFLQPNLIVPFELLAQIHQQKKDVRKKNLMLARARLNEAHALAHEDSLESSLQLCRKALAFDPFNAEAFALTGFLQHRLGDSSAAEKSFRTALRQKQVPPKAHKLYALYLFQRNKADAGEQLVRAVQLLPNDIELREVYAAWLENAGKAEEAAAQRARKHFSLGRRYEAAGRLDAALEEYRTAAALSPNADFLAAQGITFLKKRLPVEAEIYLRQSLEADQQNFLALYGYGLRFSLQEPEEALAYFQRALAVEPENTAVHRALAELYTRMERKEEAVYHLQKAEQLSIDPAEF